MLLVQAESPGSSVDPDGTIEPMVVQQSGSRQDSTAAQTSDSNKGNKAGTKDNTESNTPAAPPPKR